MLFDFQKFVNDLRDNPEKKEVVEKYEKAFWPIEWDLYDQTWYKEYISGFPTLEYRKPPELANDFDWDVLMQFVAASFSSDGLMEDVDDEHPEPEFVISVQSGDQVVVKKITELRWFQMIRLYDIYCEEQMNLAVLVHEDEKEREAIVAQRESRKKRRALVMDNLESDKLKKADNAEKAWKLDDLMGQL